MVSSPQKHATLRVLIVDDDEDMRFLLERILVRSRMEVVVLSCALEALDRLEREPFDVLVTDHSMRSMDGPSLARAVREREREVGRARTRIVGVTGCVLPDVERASREAGMDAWLSKPFEPSDLIAAVRPSAASEVVAIDPEIAVRMPRYFARRRADLVAGRHALEHRDFDAVARMGHALRGHAGTYGLMELSEIGDRLERAGLTTGVAEIASALGELEGFLESRGEAR